VQEFVRACFRLKAEIIAEHYTREKLVEMTGIDMPLQAEIDAAKQQLQAYQSAQQQYQQAQQAQQQQPQGQPGQAPMPPQMPVQPPPQIPAEVLQQMQMTVKAVAWEDIESILRSDQRRGYKVDIETDDTAQFDEQAEKEGRIEFLNTMQPVMQNALLMTQQSPELLPLAKETTLFAVRAFKAGRNLEEAFEDAFDQLASKPPTPPQPSPEMAKVGIEKSKADAEIQIKQQLAVHEAEKMQIENQLKAADLQGKQLDIQGKQLDLHAKNQQMNFDFLQGQLDVANQSVANDRANEAHQMEMEATRQGMQQGQEAAAAKNQAIVAKAQNAPQNTVKTPSKPQIGAPSQPPSQAQPQAPVSQLQQVLMQLASGQEKLMQSNELLVRAVTAPKTTKLIKDASGRSVAAVQQTLGFDQATAGNA
jgi:hypothetical protein